MRENKFRAFKDGSWWYSNDEAYNLKEYNGVLYLCEDVKFYRNTEEYELGIIGVAYQYTGLKDKNGIEIYEGDILNHDGFLGCVSYINSGNCNVLGYVLSSLINNRIFYMFCDEADDYEIIGNIYENPELLRED